MARNIRNGRARGAAGISTSRHKSRAKTRRRAANRHALRAVVGVGASAGGLEAFSAVLENLPAATGMSIVFVSHLDPKHESILTSLLARATPMPVLEAKHGMVLERNHVYVIPRNARMTVDKGSLSLSRRLQPPAENLPIDHFLKSLARDRQQRAIGVILSGTASDGTIGLTAIKNAAGVTIAQSPGTARYDGMPRSAIKAKVVDFVLSPREIAEKLAQIARSPEPPSRAAERPGTPVPPAEGLAEIFAHLRDRTGADFSTYKEATVERRVRRRMALGRIRSVAEYARFLRREPAEVDALYEDLLIKVTEFFRDPKTFERLKTRILPGMLKKKPPKEPFRVWVPGCSTGEEAYSIAMLLFEVMASLRIHNPIQIFGTDLSDRAIVAARRGIYPTSIAGSVSPARRRQFFVKSGEGYKVGQRVREVCVFARQDITRDPPFSKVDLVSCRNVLIYMGKTLQDTILSIFHYALKPDGCLLLGKAEALDGSSDLFASVDVKHRIYRRKTASAAQVAGFSARPAEPVPGRAVRAAGKKQPRVQDDATVLEEANRLIIERYAPAGVVINEKSEILEILGDTHPYVRLAPGTANLSLLRLVRRDLVPQLSAAIDLARSTGAPVRREGWPTKSGHDGPGGPYLDVVPMNTRSDRERRLLVLFETAAPPSADEPLTSRTAGARSKRGGSRDGRDVVRLRKALAESQEHLRLLMDSRQSAEEELKSANEELMSSMEELQSANEELQTSHEELESTNEELTTVNDQLAIRNRDLTEISNDLTNLVTSVDVPIVILSGSLRLRRSTVAADKVMGLTRADVGRHLSEIRHTLRLPSLEREAAEVLKTLGTKTIEVQDRLNVWYSMRLSPYRTEDDRIDGLVIVLFEIDRLKRSFQEVERARNFSRTIVEAVQEPLLVLGEGRRVVIANQAFLETFRTSRAEIENRPVFALEPGGFRSAAFKRMLDDVRKGQGRPHESEIEFKISGLKSIIMSIVARQFETHQDNGTIVLLTMKDITRFKVAERLLVAARDSVQRGRLRAESSLRESRQDLSASRAELRVLAGRLIRAQEDERKRVARELHDDLSQRLSALQLGSAGLARLAPKGASSAAGFAAHQEHLAEVVEEVRRLAYDLHPAILTHLGLRAALQSFCVEFSAREEIDVDFSAQKEPAALPEEIALCLYRVTQEALRNVARHAGTKSASVSLKTARGGLSLTIEDRGRGFRVHPGRPGEGLGLLSMHERVRLVDGTFQVKSRIGHGTRIEVQVPVPAKPA
jgi:two-component system, chemotaxis family, CheB/CheR fusion protein